MYCTHCGNKCQDDMKYCPKCGNMLIKPATDKVSVPKQYPAPQLKFKDNKKNAGIGNKILKTIGLVIAIPFVVLASVSTGGAVFRVQKLLDWYKKD